MSTPKLIIFVRVFSDFLSFETSSRGGRCIGGRYFPDQFKDNAVETASLIKFANGTGNSERYGTL